jgi:hypothetical protein
MKEHASEVVQIVRLLPESIFVHSVAGNTNNEL